MTLKINGKPAVIKDKDIIDFAIFTLSFCMQQIIDTGESLPMFNVCDGDRMHCYSAAWKDAAEKEHFFRMIKSECEKMNAHYVIGVVDTWVSSRLVEKEEVKNLNQFRPDIPPSKDPDRTEALILMICVPNGDIDAICAPYNRKTKGETIFKNLYWMTSGKMAFNLLKPWTGKYN